MARRRWTETTAAAAALTGLIIVGATGHPVALGAVTAALGAIAFFATTIKRWVTDTSDEKLRLRIATEKADEARNQALVAQAARLSERERDRREVEEIRRDCADRIADAEARAQQAEVTYAQRAAEAEREAERYAAQIVAEKAETLLRQFEEKRAQIMAASYWDGVEHALTGQLDALLDARRTVIPLDSRRAAPSPTSAAN